MQTSNSVAEILICAFFTRPWWRNMEDSKSCVCTGRRNFPFNKKSPKILRLEQIMKISQKKYNCIFDKSTPFNILGGKSNGMKITGNKFSKNFNTLRKVECVNCSIISFCHYKFLIQWTLNPWWPLSEGRDYVAFKWLKNMLVSYMHI